MLIQTLRSPAIHLPWIRNLQRYNSRPSRQITTLIFGSTAGIPMFNAQGDSAPFWGGGNTTQALVIIPADDPFQPQVDWNTTTDPYHDRVVSTTSHTPFPEQPRAVVDVCLPWLPEQSSKLKKIMAKGYLGRLDVIRRDKLDKEGNSKAKSDE